MKTSDMFKTVRNNIDLINKQVEENDQTAIQLGQLYNMNIDRMEMISLTLFECAFEEWYNTHKAIIKV